MAQTMFDYLFKARASAFRTPSFRRKVPLIRLNENDNALLMGIAKGVKPLQTPLQMSKSKKAYIPRLYAFLQGEKLLCKLSKRKDIFLCNIP